MVRYLLKNLLLGYKNYQALVKLSFILLFVLGSEEEKLKFAFKIYDIDGDGFISNGELFAVII